MLTDLLLLVPVGLALGLVAFGHYGDRRPEPTPARIGLTARIAVDLAARLERGEQRASGVISAAEAFEPGELLREYGLNLVQTH